MSQRRDPVFVRNLRIGSSIRQETGYTLENRSPITRDYSLQERGPSQIVHMINIDCGANKMRTIFRGPF